jgi:hypothetical protein
LVLSKAELIAALAEEVRILLHLAGKADRRSLEYRPTPRQRSTAELLKYLSMMGPTLVKDAKAGAWDEAGWATAEQAAQGRSVEQALETIASHPDAYAALLADVSDADLRAEVEMFGEKSTLGAFLVKWVLSGCAAYRMQVFLYLKASGHEELNTSNLWSGVDASPEA